MEKCITILKPKNVERYLKLKNKFEFFYVQNNRKKNHNSRKKNEPYI